MVDSMAAGGGGGCKNDDDMYSSSSLFFARVHLEAAMEIILGGKDDIIESLYDELADELDDDDVELGVPRYIFR